MQDTVKKPHSMIMSRMISKCVGQSEIQLCTQRVCIVKPMTCPDTTKRLLEWRAPKFERVTESKLQISNQCQAYMTRLTFSAHKLTALRLARSTYLRDITSKATVTLGRLPLFMNSDVNELLYQGSRTRVQTCYTDATESRTL